MQSDLAGWTQARVTYLKGEIRNLYWHIRTTRRGLQDAYRMRVYRRIKQRKRELERLGVPHREVLDLIACCRRQVCHGCSHCGGLRLASWI